MSKILCVSDLHFSRWIRNNPEKDYRMKIVPHKLAERIIDICKENQINYLMILGDIINTWSEDPQVIEVLRDFLSTIISSIPTIKIYYILGQHDLFIQDKFDIDGSYVHLMTRIFPQNVFYAHDQYFDIDDTSIYMSSFCRKGVMYPQKKVNLFLSHITFGFNHKIDESNFDLCIAGDIHAIYDSGKCHSCCTPYQLYAHEEKYGYLTIVELNGSNSKSYRIKSDSNKFEFPKFESISKRKVKNKINNEISSINLDESDIIKMINDEVAKHGLSDLHETMKSNIPHPIDFHFQLHNLIIDNLRSIDHLEIDFDKLPGINYFSGHTGSGKSSIFNSIRWIFEEVKDLSVVNNKITGRPCRIQLSLTYDNKEYYISKCMNAVDFKINGESVKMSKKGTQQMIEKELPFVKYWSYFYMRSNMHYFQSINKTELMQILFNLRIFEQLFNESDNRIKNMNRNIRLVNEEIIRLNGERSANDESMKRLSDQYSSLPDCKYSLKEVESDSSKFNEYLDNLHQCESSLKEMRSNKSNLKSDLEDYSRYKDLDVFACESRINELNKIISDANNISAKKNELKGQIKQIDSMIITLNQLKVDSCPKCGYILSNSDKNQKLDHLNEERMKLIDEESKIQISDISRYLDESHQLIQNIQNKNQYEKIKNDLTKLSDKIKDTEMRESDNYSSLQDFLKKYESESYESIQKNFDQLKSSINLKENTKIQIENLKSRIEEIDAEISEKENNLKLGNEYLQNLIKYNKLFDIHDESSIPLAIQNKLVSYLNSESIQFKPVKTRNGFDIDVFIKIKDQWISYMEASDGQKCYLDIFILIKITEFMGGVGLLIMDEPISNMSPDYITEACELIPSIDANTILISSHSKIDGYDNLIKLELGDDGLTKIEGLIK